MKTKFLIFTLIFLFMFNITFFDNFSYASDPASVFLYYDTLNSQIGNFGYYNLNKEDGFGSSLSSYANQGASEFMKNKFSDLSEDEKAKYYNNSLYYESVEIGNNIDAIKEHLTSSLYKTYTNIDNFKDSLNDKVNAFLVSTIVKRQQNLNYIKSKSSEFIDSAGKFLEEKFYSLLDKDVNVQYDTDYINALKDLNNYGFKRSGFGMEGDILENNSIYDNKISKSFSPNLDKAMENLNYGDYNYMYDLLSSMEFRIQFLYKITEVLKSNSIDVSELEARSLLYIPQNLYIDPDIFEINEITHKEHKYSLHFNVFFKDEEQMAKFHRGNGNSYELSNSSSERIPLEFNKGHFALVGKPLYLDYILVNNNLQKLQDRYMYYKRQGDYKTCKEIQADINIFNSLVKNSYITKPFYIVYDRYFDLNGNYKSSYKEDNYDFWTTYSLLPSDIFPTINLPFTNNKEIEKFRYEYHKRIHTKNNMPVNFTLSFNDLLEGDMSSSKATDKDLLVAFPMINSTDLPVNNKIPTAEEIKNSLDKSKEIEKLKNKEGLILDGVNVTVNNNTTFDFSKLKDLLLKDYLKGLLDLIKSLFIPEETFFTEYYQKIISSVNFNLPFDKIKSIFSLMQGNSSSWKFPDLYIGEVKVIDSSLINDNIPKLKIFTNWFFWLLLILYNINNLYKFITGRVLFNLTELISKKEG